MKFYFFIFLLSLNSFCQNLSVDYKFAIVDDKDEYGIIGFGAERLITSAKESLSYAKNIDTTVVIKGREEVHSQQASNFSPTRFKDIARKESFCKTLFGHVLKDDTYKIKWTITKENKKILGYSCQQAKGIYRGRNYIAYFATEIPIQNGPHNFDGLPGLILEVYSDDGVVQFNAFQITKSTEEIKNPFVSSEYISWAQFTKAYEEYFNRMINYKPEEDMTIIVPNRSVEIYIQ